MSDKIPRILASESRKDGSGIDHHPNGNDDGREGDLATPILPAL